VLPQQSSFVNTITVCAVGEIRKPRLQGSGQMILSCVIAQIDLSEVEATQAA
jgi:hypothetical protein